jgi:hypothetical protein
VYWLAPNRITKEVRLYPAYPWDDASMIRTAAQ